MPAVNALNDEGHLDVMPPDTQAALTIGGQDVSTMSNTTDGDFCNVHVALFALLGVAFVIILRKSGIHAIQLEG